MLMKDVISFSATPRMKASLCCVPASQNLTVKMNMGKPQTASPGKHRTPRATGVGGA